MEKCYTYQSIFTIGSTSMHLTDDGAKRGEFRTLGGYKYHVYQFEECVCAPMYPMGKGMAHC